jgi:glucose/arabinose dehydrogenase
LKNYLLVFRLMLLCAGCLQVVNAGCSSGIKSAPFTISLQLVAYGLEGPIGMVVANDGSSRLFVVDQTGTIRIIKNGQLLPTPFLDVSSKLSKVNSIYSEKGLLGLVFHPQFKTNGKFYIYYSAPTDEKGMDNKSVIAECRVSSQNPDIANVEGRVLLEIQEPESNHNGGQLAFGPDGYLYIGVGDGGGAGDQHGTIGNGQNMNTLLGKILRIDVNTDQGYNVPSDNPFVNRKDVKPEIFAYGMRNPWRFSFDKKTGQLYCGDVGQNMYEEVDVIEKGKNYGWRIMEGFHCYNPSQGCNMNGLTLPISEYDHTIGKCIIGGFVYRGPSAADWLGRYIYGDWTGKIFALIQQPATQEWNRFDLSIQNQPDNFYINSFGEDEAGELYVVGQKGVGAKKSGAVYKMVLQ